MGGGVSFNNPRHSWPVVKALPQNAKAFFSMDLLVSLFWLLFFIFLFVCVCYITIAENDFEKK